MFGKQFQLNEQSIPVVQEIGKHMPGGFLSIRRSSRRSCLMHWKP